MRADLELLFPWPVLPPSTRLSFPAGADRCPWNRRTLYEPMKTYNDR
jgi:hypothetical protein